MTLAPCRCRVPVRYENPIRRHLCVKCGFWLDPTWASDDESFRHYYDGLAHVLDAKGELADPEDANDWDIFRAQCAYRERAGREQFGHRYLSRDNVADCYEEATDGSNYILFDTLVARREGRDPEMGAALGVSYRFYQAHREARFLKGRRKGAP